MQVQIEELSSTVKAMDGETMLSPQVMERILRVVLQAIEERERHQSRVRAEQRVTAGVSQELEEE